MFFFQTIDLTSVPSELKILFYYSGERARDQVIRSQDVFLKGSRSSVISSSEYGGVVRPAFVPGCSEMKITSSSS